MKFTKDVGMHGSQLHLSRQTNTRTNMHRHCGRTFQIAKL